MLLLCIDQRRRIKLEKYLAAFDRIAGRLDREILDPAIDSRIDLQQCLLVVRDVTDGLDAS